MQTDYKDIQWAEMRAFLDSNVESWYTPEGLAPRDYYLIFALVNGSLYRCLLWRSNFSSNQQAGWIADRDLFISVYIPIIDRQQLLKKSAQPITSDGRPYILPNIFAPVHHAAWTSLADDPLTGTRWGGVPFELSQTDIGTTSVSYQYMEWIYFAGGSFSNRGAKHGDNINYKLYAPSSLPVESSNLAGTGAFNKFPIYTGSTTNIYIPSADSTGSLDLDLTTTFSPNVKFTKAVPVTASKRDGWFDLDLNTYALTVNTTQTGKYNLFDTVIPLATFAAGVRITKDSDVDLMVPAISPKLVLPQWIHQVDIHHSKLGSTVDIVWSIFISRKHTY